jgi:hypothetical protein
MVVAVTARVDQKPDAESESRTRASRSASPRRATPSIETPCPGAAPVLKRPACATAAMDEVTTR